MVTDAEPKLVQYDRVRILSGDPTTEKYIGLIGTVVGSSFEQGGWSYLVQTPVKDIELNSCTWWYAEESLEIIPPDENEFNNLSSDEKTAFIRELVGQLYLNPRAYHQYKNLYESLGS